MSDISNSTKQMQLATFDLFYEELPLYGRGKATKLIRKSKKQ